MAQPAEKLMTVAEFLAWDDGTDKRYELVDGRPVAMNPPGGPHRTIAANATALLSITLRDRPPCRPEQEAGITITEHQWRQADVAVTCQPPAPGDIIDPLLIVEVLSPSNRRTDLLDKLREYKSLPSVQEVCLIDSERRWVEVWQRDTDAAWVGRNYVGSAKFDSPVLRASVMLDELYRNVEA
jgi:Uma2 family endonuclease